MLVKNLYAQTWESFGPGIDGVPSHMTEYNGKMYVAYAQHTSPHTFLVSWDGTAWSSVTVLDNSNSNLTGRVFKILDMIEYQGYLYVGGDFDSIGGIAANCIAKFDGTTWSAVGEVSFQGTTCCTPQVYRLAIYNGELYVTGTFDSINNIDCKSIARWDGTEWRALNVILPSSVIVQGVCVYNEELYMGIMYLNTNIWEIVKYNTTNMQTIGTLYGSVVSSNVLMEFNQKLYLGGYFSSVNSILNMHNFAVWDGSSWSPFGDGPTYDTASVDMDGMITSLVVSGSNLYIGGYFKYLNNICVNNIARYDGYSVQNLGVGVTEYYGSINCLSLYNNSVCVAGDFDTINNIAVQNIAMLIDDGIVTTVSESASSGLISIYPNPFTETWTIHFSDNEQHVIQLIDAFGKILTETRGSTKVSFMRNDIPPGIYGVRITDVHGNVTVRKIIAT